MNRLVFFGTPEFAVPSLARLIAHPDFEVVGVVTQPDKRRGRGAHVSASPVKTAALKAGCPIWQPQRLKRDQAAWQTLRQAQADAFIVVAYGQILPQTVLDIPRLGCINAHGSILPAYRGAAPIQWSLYHGESETGVTTMKMDAGMDTGPMLLTQTLPLGLLDNAWEVAAQLAQISADLLVTTLLQWPQLQAVPQNERQASYAPLIQKQDYVIDWAKPALAIHNQVRGFYPGGVTAFRGHPLKIMATVPLGEAFWPKLPPSWQTLAPLYQSLDLPSAPPGALVGLIKNYGPVIATGDGHLLLHQVQPGGKKVQSGWDFVNGNHLTLGELLGG